MPHLILECSQDIHAHIDFKALFRIFHELLAEQLPTQITNCKSRVIVFDQTYAGSQCASYTHLHLTIKIMPGRAAALKQTITQQILRLLDETIKKLAVKHATISVEMIDLADNYVKLNG
ncbi:MAG: hypothetical protein CMF38_01775 [Legionellaceae bacterium]|nr:hypothetical protein [Legionellaceae bacterium]|tara:strand:+ start:1607 stop:1963 length:357 start_codon:yes stop_codon:yes gene_type:complete